MKKLKKVILVLTLVICLCGCTLFNKADEPADKVENLLKKYQAKDMTITNQLDEVMMDEELTTAQNEKYRSLMLKQYETLTYSINEGTVTDDTAAVSVDITVLDYASAIKQAQTDYETNPAQFYDAEGNPSTEKYMDHKIALMEQVNTTVTYTLDLTLTKVNDEWEVDDLTEIDLQKIHGLY